MAEYKKVNVKAGPGGWGGPLVIEPKEGKSLIVSITGGGIHPLAQKIAELTGGEAFDGFKGGAKFENIACAVIDLRWYSSCGSLSHEESSNDRHLPH